MTTPSAQSAAPSRSGEAPARRGVLGWMARHETPLNWILVGGIVLGGFLFLHALPVDRAMTAIGTWVRQFGWYAPLAFGLGYIVAALLMISGAAMSVVAGTIFPLWVAFLTINLSATIAGTLAFLIGRYIARGKVEAWARRRRRFRAIDAALDEGGLKMILLLRISPVVPFTPLNYALGATSVRLWPYILGTWLGTMPGTLLYVYIGGMVRASFSADTQERTWQEWTYLGVGLVATLVLTIYLTRLARRKLKEQTNMDAHETSATHTPRSHPTWRFWALAAGLVLVLIALPFRDAAARQITALFGPPAVMMTEAYQNAPDSADFDHSAFDALLKAHVDADGFVDYEALAKDRAKLDAYIQRLAKAPFDQLNRDEKLSLLINAYNAYMLQLVLEEWPVKNILQDIDDPFKRERWTLAGQAVSLDKVEHEMIRANFKEPRIHWAVVCGAVGCPKLRNEAYTGAKLEQQLQDQAQYVHSHPRYIRYEPGSGTIHLTSLYDWYRGDFEQAAGSVLAYVAQYRPELKQRLDDANPPEIKYLDYSWAVNDVSNRAMLPGQNQ